MSIKEKFLIEFIRKHGSRLALACEAVPFKKKMAYEKHVLRHAWKSQKVKS